MNGKRLDIPPLAPFFSNFRQRKIRSLPRSSTMQGTNMYNITLFVVHNIKIDTPKGKSSPGGRFDSSLGMLTKKFIALIQVIYI